MYLLNINRISADKLNGEKQHGMGQVFHNNNLKKDRKKTWGGDPISVESITSL